MPTESVDPNAPEMATAVVRGSGEEIFYDVVDGMAIIEGDIILGTHAEVQQFGIEPLGIAPPQNCPEGTQCGAINTSRVWTNGVIPYTLTAGTSSSAAQVIQEAINEWENKTSIRFVRRSNERDYVEFVGTGSGSVCSSALGRAGGRQLLLYSGNGRGCLVHEIGHVVGLHHEQNRNDRDEFINIDFSNLAGNAASQFRKATNSTDVGRYDFNSVMHYSAFTFALDRSRPVITAKDGRDPRSIGSRGVLTPSDVEAVEFVYGRPSPTPAPPTPAPTPPPTSAPTTSAPSPETTTTEAPPTPETTTTEAPPTPETTTTEAPPTPETTTTEAPPTPETTRPPRPRPTPPPTPAPSPETTTPREPDPEPTTSSVVATTTQPSTTSETTPSTAPPVDPPGDRKPKLSFSSIQDGGTIGADVPYGGINVVAYDPDVGSADGDGIRWVTLVLSDAETGRFLGARREYWSTYDWGLRLRSGRSYVLTAYAVSDQSAGGGWSQTSITITAE